MKKVSYVLNVAMSPFISRKKKREDSIPLKSVPLSITIGTEVSEFFHADEMVRSLVAVVSDFDVTKTL